jgi:hypothetical protein
VAPLTAGKAFLAASRFFEVYESSRIEMGPVQEPTVLGSAWGIGGAVGTLVVDTGAIKSVTVA